MTNVPKLWTEQELAAYFGVTQQTVKRERQRGRLKFARVAKKVRFTDAQIQEYLSSRECVAEDAKAEKPKLAVIPRTK